MESGAKGCEVVVSGKLRAARAKSMKFTDGFMIHSGQPVRTLFLNLFFLVINDRSAISLILLLVTFFFVKVFLELKSKFSLMNSQVERGRNLFLMLSSLLSQRKSMLKVLVNQEVLMLILVLLIKLPLLLNHKHMDRMLDISKVDILKEVFNRKFINSCM